MGSRIDLTGRRYGRLVVVRSAPKSSMSGRLKWECLCDCGSRCEVKAQAIQKGEVRSCGCLRVEAAMANVVTNTRHEMTGTKTYQAWSSMKRRCLVSSDPAFPGYGGRGIAICDAWLGSFEAFLSDMGIAPEGMTLERDNVDGNYELGNCRWASNEDQQNNKRNSIRITYMGETKTAAQWERHLGYRRGLIQLRLQRGWSVDRAMQPPSRNAR